VVEPALCAGFDPAGAERRLHPLAVLTQRRSAGVTGVVAGATLALSQFSFTPFRFLMSSRLPCLLLALFIPVAVLAQDAPVTGAET